VQQQLGHGEAGLEVDLDAVEGGGAHGAFYRAETVS
jgi:hypothetical protein